jgi:hypothetical protein
MIGDTVRAYGHASVSLSWLCVSDSIEAWHFGAANGER